MPFFQPQVICKLAQPLGPTPVLKYLIGGLHFQSLNKIVMQRHCMSEVEGAWDHLVQYLYFVKEETEDQRN